MYKISEAISQCRQYHKMIHSDTLTVYFLFIQFTVEANASALATVLQEIEILYAPYGVNQAAANSRVIVDWLEGSPFRVLFMASENISIYRRQPPYEYFRIGRIQHSDHKFMGLGRPNGKCGIASSASHILSKAGDKAIVPGFYFFLLFL